MTISKFKIFDETFPSSTDNKVGVILSSPKPVFYQKENKKMKSKFKVGDQVEATINGKTWRPANIIEIDINDLSPPYRVSFTNGFTTWRAPSSVRKIEPRLKVGDRVKCSGYNYKDLIGTVEKVSQEEPRYFVKFDTYPENLRACRSEDLILEEKMKPEPRIEKFKADDRIRVIDKNHAQYGKCGTIISDNVDYQPYFSTAVKLDNCKDGFWFNNRQLDALAEPRSATTSTSNEHLDDHFNRKESHMLDPKQEKRLKAASRYSRFNFIIGVMIGSGLGQLVLPLAQKGLVALGHVLVSVGAPPQ